MNTSPQTRAGDGRGFHYSAQRRVVPKPWLLSQGGVHSRMKSLVLVVAQRTSPSGPVLDRSGFHGENVFLCFFIKKIQI